MYFIFVLNHPAHYHLFKNVIADLKFKNHDCEIFIRPKDVLQNLLDNDGMKYHKFSMYNRGKKGIIVSSLLGLAKKNIELINFIKKKKPDLLIGTDWAITTVGKISGIPSIVFNEDDTIATPENKLFYRLADTLVLPDCCDQGLWGRKRVSYAGYHELAYLHSARFQFNPKLIENLIDLDTPYIIIRLVKLTASHDIGKKGLGYTLLDEIIRLADNDHQILISFEGDYDSKYERFRFKFDPTLMHHFLAGAKMVIGDSQTMIAEAAVLGTPAIRFNDFVGKLGYLNELEQKYSLAFGFSTKEKERFLTKVNDLLMLENLKNIWLKKLSKLYEDKINVSDFFLWFLENYPHNLEIMKDNPDYQLKFR